MDETHYRKAYEEALNILRIRTGRVGWDRYIESLTELGLTEVSCAECGGDGRRAARAFMMTIDAGTCDRCNGMGTLTIPREIEACRK